jgi:hypothetical protein
MAKLEDIRIRIARQGRFVNPQTIRNYLKKAGIGYGAKRGSLGVVRPGYYTNAQVAEFMRWLKRHPIKPSGRQANYGKA